MTIISSTVSDLSRQWQIINKSDKLFLISHWSFSDFSLLLNTGYVVRPIWFYFLSLSSHFTTSAGPMCSGIPVTMTTRSRWGYLCFCHSISPANVLLHSTPLIWGELSNKRKADFYSVLSWQANFTLYQAVDCLIGLIAWCFVSGVYMLNEQEYF